MSPVGKRGLSIRLFCGLIACLPMGVLVEYAAADEIVLQGARYRDVLVHKSSTSYYVQIPWEGRTVSARIEGVDASTVSINEDPYYRDKLKAEYREAKELRDSGQLSTAPDDSMFRVRAQSSSSDFKLYSDGAGTGGGGAGGGAGLGVPRSQIESMLAGFGVQFQGGPSRGGMPTVVGQMPTGVRIELIGPPNRLMGVDVTATGPASQVTASASQMQIFVVQIAPGVAREFPAMIQEAQQSGQSQRTVDGVSAQISMREVGEMVEFRMSVMAVN